jgi:hypothetical protein
LAYAVADHKDGIGILVSKSVTSPTFGAHTMKVPIRAR